LVKVGKEEQREWMPGTGENMSNRGSGFRVLSSGFRLEEVITMPQSLI